MIKGYFVEADWDGQRLLARGTNKAAKIGLNGQDWEQDVVVPRDQIAAVEHKTASPLVNGRVTVHTRSGKTHKLHYRRKDRDAWAAFAAELQSVVTA